MTDHEIPEPPPPTEPGPGTPGPGTAGLGAAGDSSETGEGPELAAVTVALADVPDPPTDRLERAVHAALAAYDVETERRGRRADAVVPLARRRTGGGATHRRLAAIAAALVVLAGLTGLLVARNPLRSTVDDTAVMSQEAALDPQASTTAPPPTAPGARSAAATATGAAPTTTSAGALTPSATDAAPPTLGSYIDAAALVATVRAEASSPRTDDASPLTEDGGTAPGSSRAICGAPNGTPRGDALIGATRVLVVLEAPSTGTSTGTSAGAAVGAPTRIRVYAAADCVLLLDEPLTG